MLQIKAKETQLVRARSDAENAEERANSLSKEIDRLKREMSRLGRGRAGSDAPSDGPQLNGADLAAPGMRPAYGSSRSYNVPSARAYGGVDGFSNGVGVGMGVGEGKENVPDLHNVDVGSKLSGVSAAPTSHRPSTRGSSGEQATPSTAEDGFVGGGPPSGLQRNSSAGGEGVESWRRAAEVTQNLKARIEMMKVCCRVPSGRVFADGYEQARQNIGRGQ